MCSFGDGDEDTHDGAPDLMLAYRASAPDSIWEAANLDAETVDQIDARDALPAVDQIRAEEYVFSAAVLRRLEAETEIEALEERAKQLHARAWELDRPGQDKASRRYPQTLRESLVELLASHYLPSRETPPWAAWVRLVLRALAPDGDLTSYSVRRYIASTVRKLEGPKAKEGSRPQFAKYVSDREAFARYEAAKAKIGLLFSLCGFPTPKGSSPEAKSRDLQAKNELSKIGAPDEVPMFGAPPPVARPVPALAGLFPAERRAALNRLPVSERRALLSGGTPGASSLETGIVPEAQAEESDSAHHEEASRGQSPHVQTPPLPRVRRARLPSPQLSPRGSRQEDTRTGRVRDDLRDQALARVKGAA